MRDGVFPLKKQKKKKKKKKNTTTTTNNNNNNNNRNIGLTQRIAKFNPYWRDRLTVTTVELGPPYLGQLQNNVVCPSRLGPKVQNRSSQKLQLWRNYVPRSCNWRRHCHAEKSTFKSDGPLNCRMGDASFHSIVLTFAGAVHVAL